VPQGSVLGPLLLLVLISDIDKGTGNSFLSSFADDTNLSQVITKEEHINLLQDDLNKIYVWPGNNNMKFNEEKFELLRCGPDQNIKKSTDLHTEGGQKIISKPQVKCLCVHLDEEATFHHHIKITVNKAIKEWQVGS